MAAKKMTRYYFKFKSDTDPNFTRKMIGDELEEDSAIADNLKKAKEIMVAGYGPNVLCRLQLDRQEEVTMFEPAKDFVHVPDDDLGFLDEFNTKLVQRIHNLSDPFEGPL